MIEFWKPNFFVLQSQYEAFAPLEGKGGGSLSDCLMAGEVFLVCTLSKLHGLEIVTVMFQVFL
jgi:hypothetical protein